MKSVAVSRRGVHYRSSGISLQRQRNSKTASYNTRNIFAKYFYKRTNIFASRYTCEIQEISNLPVNVPLILSNCNIPPLHRPPISHRSLYRVEAHKSTGAACFFRSMHGVLLMVSRRPVRTYRLIMDSNPRRR